MQPTTCAKEQDSFMLSRLPKISKEEVVRTREVAWEGSKQATISSANSKCKNCAIEILDKTG